MTGFIITSSSIKSILNAKCTGWNGFSSNWAIGRKKFYFNQREKQSLLLTFLTQPAKIMGMMTPAELVEFNEIKDALDIVNASKYTEAQINGMEKYLDEVRSYHSGIADAKKEGLEISSSINEGL
jgi:hypothetical protein